MQYLQTSYSPILHTESTAYIDSEDALSSSGRFEREVLFTTEGSDYPSMKPDYMAYPPQLPAYYSSNPQLLRTQPVREIAPTAPMHTHTRSYDFNYMNPGQYPMSHYM